jgi:hemerythrin-like domain-containing protein
MRTTEVMKKTAARRTHKHHTAMVMEDPLRTPTTAEREPVDPIEALMHEHELGLHQLGLMADAAKSIQVNGFSAGAFQTIADAIRFIGTEIRRHNEKEERLLFPLIDRHVSGPPSAMRQEHRELWRAFNELLKSVRDVEDGRIHGSSIRELVQMVNFIVEHLRDHIDKENTVLFPMAKQVLTEEEYRMLGNEITRNR